ncbi:hypothetical protein CHS0354_010514 [Potamilus streckersoni]|uniref:RNase H type-1 domain-containing protein n=1 Tax=Potamilus streckersoni TaxID=2493646 RepID=A0AAE0S5J3_9BIVA|nr:hypothetical protein CHS0354_010514 [Potamilus streckersoni]
MPVTRYIDFKPMPVTRSIAFKPMPVTRSIAFKPMPVTRSIAFKPMPVTRSIAFKLMPISKSTAFKLMPPSKTTYVISGARVTSEKTEEEGKKKTKKRKEINIWTQPKKLEYREEGKTREKKENKRKIIQKSYRKIYRGGQRKKDPLCSNTELSQTQEFSVGTNKSPGPVLQTLQTGEGNTRLNLLEASLMIVQELSDNHKTIDLLWVPYHIHLSGNNAADLVAKQSTTLPQPINRTLSTKEICKVIKTHTPTPHSKTTGQTALKEETYTIHNNR